MLPWTAHLAPAEGW